MSDFTIPLTRGRVALVDENDHAALSAYRWSADTIGRTTYAVRMSSRKDGKKKIYMHRVLVPGAPEVDHINGNGLDNRRANLRRASRQQNAANGVKKGTTSSMKGVCWDQARKKWKAQIKINYRTHFLGRFNSEMSAGVAYDAAAVAAFGEFARINTYL